MGMRAVLAALEGLMGGWGLEGGVWRGYWGLGAVGRVCRGYWGLGAELSALEGLIGVWGLGRYL